MSDLAWFSGASFDNTGFRSEAPWFRCSQSHHPRESQAHLMATLSWPGPGRSLPRVYTVQL